MKKLSSLTEKRTRFSLLSREIQAKKSPDHIALFFLGGPFPLFNLWDVGKSVLGEREEKREQKIECYYLLCCKNEKKKKKKKKNEEMVPREGVMPEVVHSLSPVLEEILAWNQDRPSERSPKATFFPFFFWRQNFSAENRH